MPWAVAAAAVGAAGSMYASSSASDAQEEAAQRAEALQREQYQQTRADLSPYRDSGSAANAQQTNLMGFGGQDARNAAFAMYQTDPAYQWQRQQAIDAVQGSAAARGSLASGNTLRGISDRTQNVANLDYSNYWQRLAGMSERGQNAAAQTGSYGAAAAQGQANSALERGAAQGAGYAGMANGLNQGINNGLNYFANRNANNNGAFGSYTSSPNETWGIY